MITADYHLHTAFSTDSEASMKSMIEAAVQRGLTTICFTDHHDYDFLTPEGEREFQLDTASYVDAVSKYQIEYQDRIEIRLGIELGLMNHLAPRCQELIAAYPFDFVIGSSHLVRGTDPYYPIFFEKYSEKDGIHAYFESILENIEADCPFDVYGHLDYVVRYAPHQEESFHYRDHADLLDTILTKIIESDRGIECNTAGLKYGLGFPHPNPIILKRYRELGGTILTIGSDGHAPEQIAYDFAQVSELLKDAGFRYYCIFRNRTKEFLPL